MAVTYGAISFAYPQTELNMAGPEMDPSNSDQKLTTIRLKIRAVLNPAIEPALRGGNLSSPALIIAAIRHHLTAPRKALYYDLVSPPYQKIGPAIIDIPDGRDDANGPIPDLDAFSAVYTTPTTVEVTWAVTVKIRDCQQSAVSPPLSYRWTTSVEFDKYWKATYRQSGYVLFSSKSAVTPDSFRRTSLTPQVLPGFEREKAYYLVSADGLRCDFEFVDGQTRWAPPPPCKDLDIVQSESFPLPGGKRVGELTVFIRGMMNANPVDLEFWCMVVGYSRLMSADPLGDRKTGRLLGQAVFSTHEAKDSIDATFTISYIVDPEQDSELRSNPSKGGFWSGVVDGLNPFGTAGGVAGGVVLGGGGGQIANTSFLSQAQSITEQGRITARNQPFPWVGQGTSPRSPLNPNGYQNWAAPGVAMTGPVQGFPLADALVLYAAVLRDPCGGAALVMPNAQQIVTTVSTNPQVWNSQQGGARGATPTTGAQLTAAISGFTASQMQQSMTSPRTPSPYASDPRPGVYDLWQCSAEYIENPGVIVVPTSVPSGTSRKIRYASTQWTLRLRWVAKRVGSWPRIPLKQLNDPNWVYTGGMVPVREMRMGADQVSYVYEASGVYEFMALNPRDVKITAAIPPTLSTTAMVPVINWVEAALTGISTLSSGLANRVIPVGAAGGTTNTALSASGASPLGGASLGINVPN